MTNYLVNLLFIECFRKHFLKQNGIYFLLLLVERCVLLTYKRK